MSEGAAPWPQEIRLAMTMVGSASLAVWMSGVATETSALLHASRTPGDGSGYRKLLDLLRATVRLDVLTGTSAGGIGAAGLGLAEAFKSSPGPLRDTLLTAGSLENLIRDPNEKQPRSLLDGDRFLGDLEGALRTIAAGGTTPADAPDMTLLLPGTMIDGETCATTTHSATWCATPNTACCSASPVHCGTAGSSRRSRSPRGPRPRRPARSSSRGCRSGRRTPTGCTRT
ncbi:hypothetical protein [Amycolatopsis sp. FDAARGOS 1241]|uniref:hypothetical protein n=1 Tax=Amycolatopsis sp. FDAARGOS 1241 TaxID=2778070 RepID=UPI00351C6977